MFQTFCARLNPRVSGTLSEMATCLEKEEAHINVCSLGIALVEGDEECKVLKLQAVSFTDDNSSNGSRMTVKGPMEECATRSQASTATAAAASAAATVSAFRAPKDTGTAATQLQSPAQERRGD